MHKVKSGRPKIIKLEVRKVDHNAKNEHRAKSTEYILQIIQTYAMRKAKQSTRQ